MMDAVLKIASIAAGLANDPRALSAASRVLRYAMGESVSIADIPVPTVDRVALQRARERAIAVRELK